LPRRGQRLRIHGSAAAIGAVPWTRRDGATFDLLAREIHPKAASLDEVNRTFERSTEAFYPQAPKERLRRFLPRPVKRILSGLRRRLLG